MNNEADNSIDTYAKCRECGWVHYYDPEKPDAPWHCFQCYKVGKKSFDLIRVSEISEKDCPLGVTLNPVNREFQLLDQDKLRVCGGVTKMIRKLFKLWGLSSEEEVKLWGLAQASHDGENRDDAEAILMAEAISLLQIHRGLRILFPKNRELVYSWPTTPNRNFDGLSPVELIKRDGVAGLDRVRDYLMAEMEK